MQYSDAGNQTPGTKPIRACLTLFCLLIACSSDTASEWQPEEPDLGTDLADVQRRADLEDPVDPFFQPGCVVCSADCEGFDAVQVDLPFDPPETREARRPVASQLRQILALPEYHAEFQVRVLDPAGMADGDEGRGSFGSISSIWTEANTDVTFSLGAVVRDGYGTGARGVIFVNGEQAVPTVVEYDDDEYEPFATYRDEVIEFNLRDRAAVVDATVDASAFVPESYNEVIIFLWVTDSTEWLPILVKYNLFAGGYDLPAAPCVEDQGLSARSGWEEERDVYRGFHINIPEHAGNGMQSDQTIDVPVGEPIRVEFFANQESGPLLEGSVSVEALGLVDGRAVTESFRYLSHQDNDDRFDRHVTYRNSFEVTFEEPGTHEVSIVGWFWPMRTMVNGSGVPISPFETGTKPFMNLWSRPLTVRAIEPE